MLALAGWALLHAQNGGFRFRGVLTRVITPNGDGKNDSAVFCVDNPSDSGIDARIFSLLGRDVADLQAGTGLTLPPGSLCPTDSPVAGGARYLTWDGRSNGSVVHSGVYVYQIKAEGQTVGGTLVVVR